MTILNEINRTSELRERESLFFYECVKSNLTVCGARYYCSLSTPYRPLAFHPAKLPLIPRVSLPKIPLSPRTNPRCDPKVIRRRSPEDRSSSLGCPRRRQQIRLLRRRTSNRRFSRHRDSSVPKSTYRVSQADTLKSHDERIMRIQDEIYGKVVK